MGVLVQPTVRLSKRVSEIAACSRREAEHYIEGGWVRVDGAVVSVPGFKVSKETVELDTQASSEDVPPVTLLLHKPPDFGPGARPMDLLLTAEGHWSEDRSSLRPMRKHLLQQLCATPLETAASGLIVFTQEIRVRRKLVDDAALTENELIVDVAGPVSADTLNRLNHSQVISGRAMLPARVSINSQHGDLTGLRFAVKGWFPGQIAETCSQLGLRIMAMRRTRIGRISLGRLSVGQWRYLMPYERF